MARSAWEQEVRFVARRCGAAWPSRRTAAASAELFWTTFSCGVGVAGGGIAGWRGGAAR